MKKQILSLLMLCSYTAFTSCALVTTATVPGGEAAALIHHSLKKQRKRTDFRVLAIIKDTDGKYGMLDGYSILESFKGMSEVNSIQYGKLDKASNKRSGWYLYEGKQVTLQDLVITEQKLIKENVSKDDARWKTLNTSLTTVKADFDDKMKKVRGVQSESDMAKSIKRKLIEFWLSDQGIASSLMADVSLPEAEQKRRMAEASATEFFTFLNHLKHFLEDLIESCPEAHKQYKELLKKAH